MSKNEQPAPEGFWIVSQSSGETYESGYTRPVGIFTTEEAADAYLKAYAEADRAVLLSDHRTTNWHTWSKSFVPSVSAVPAIVTVYIYETERDEETGKRELTNVSAHHIDLNKVDAESVLGKAAHNPDRAYQEIVSEDGGNVILDSEVFPAMTLASSKDYYEGGYETFYTQNPEKIILDPPSDYVHPAPIPWTPQVKGTDGLYDWERELLEDNGFEMEQEPEEVPKDEQEEGDSDEPNPWKPQVKGPDGLYDWERELLQGN